MADIEAQSTTMINNVDHPITLKFEDVVYKIKVKQQHPSPGTESRRGCCNSLMKLMNTTKTEEKTILKGITGVVRPGEILAMLGPSGSGKTTLLTALGGRLSGDLSGRVTYNGQPFSRSLLKRTIGFVTQDDILHEHLTVRETLVYTALLRLPNSYSKEEKVTQAGEVIKKLGLGSCKDNVIGGQLVRGISGGERKRVSIGQEMLVDPSLLFLDEPTSGLDSTTAGMIVSRLREMVGRRMSVVMTIHQPSSRLFYEFSKVLLLCDGSVLYFGKGDVVMNYFGRVGFMPSVSMINPADFLLDLANGIYGNGCSESDQKMKLVLAYKENLEENVKSEMMMLQRESDDETVVMNQRLSDGKLKQQDYNEWVTTWWQQFCVLLQRDLNERKHESFSPLNIIQILITAILTGLLWFKSDKSHLQDQVGLLFFYLIFWGFFSLFQALFKFPPERLILTKERSSATYRLSSYFMARLVADLPMELILPTIFLLIIYFMTGLKPTPSSFFYNLSALLLTVLVSQGLGLALGAIFLDQKKATVVASILMLTFMIAGGFFVQQVPGFIGWIKYLSLIQYAFKLLLNSQYGEDDTYPCVEDGSKVCFVKEFPLVTSVGLKGQGIACTMLLVMVVGYRIVAYIALMRIGVSPT